MRTPGPAAARKRSTMVDRWLTAPGMPVLMQDKACRLAQSPHSSVSLAPMSRVTSSTWPRWALRKATAAASCDPPG
jgi:hypothetical protein